MTATARGLARGFRFRPPRFAIGAETAWVLARAFGPLDRGERDDFAAGDAVAQARRLALGPRLAGRLGRERLGAELGEEGATLLLADRAAAAAQELRLADLLAEVAAAAADLGVPLALLKGAALAAAGATAPGSRPRGDLDLLAPPAGAVALQVELRRRGFADVGARAYEQHLPALARAGLGLVELHTKLLGVRLGGSRRSASYGDLESAGLLAPPVTSPALPVRAVLVAHALAHGLAQHGLAPRSYAGVLMYCDLLDLGVGAATAGLPSEIHPWLERALSRAELDAAAALCRRLAAGDAARLAADSAASRLLDHALAAALDDRYAGALRRRSLARPLTDGPASRARFAVLATAARRRLGRPLRAAARLGRALADWWGLRRAGSR